MDIYGLTGGIASGKSTVSRMLRELGAQVLDADVIAREVVEPGTPGLQAVAERFPGVLAQERAALNAILHPLIGQQFLLRTQALAESGVERVIYDAPLLIENRLHEAMNGVVLVWVPREVQKARLMGRDGLDEAAAEARLAAQLPLDEKRQHATWLVDNSGDLGTTRARVEEVWRAMLARG